MKCAFVSVQCVIFRFISFRSLYGAGYCNSFRPSCINSHYRNSMFIQVGVSTHIYNTIIMLEAWSTDEKTIFQISLPHGMRAFRIAVCNYSYVYYDDI